MSCFVIWIIIFSPFRVRKTVTNIRANIHSVKQDIFIMTLIALSSKDKLISVILQRSDYPCRPTFPILQPHVLLMLLFYSFVCLCRCSKLTFLSSLLCIFLSFVIFSFVHLPNYIFFSASSCRFTFGHNWTFSLKLCVCVHDWVG